MIPLGVVGMSFVIAGSLFSMNFMPDKTRRISAVIAVVVMVLALSLVYAFFASWPTLGPDL